MKKNLSGIATIVVLAFLGGADCGAQGSPVKISGSWPSIHGGRPVEVDDLISIRDIGGRLEGLVLSHDRTAIAFQMRQMDVQANRYKIDWFVLPVTGGAPTHLGDGGDLITMVNTAGASNGSPKDPDASWSPDSQWLAYLRKSGGEVQIWRSSRDGRTQEQLTHSDADIDKFVWALDGSRLLYTLNPSRRDQQLAEQKARDEGFLWDEDFWPLYGFRPMVRMQSDNTVKVFDISSRTERKAFANEQAEFQAAVETPKLVRRPQARIVVPFGDEKRTASLEALDSELQGVLAPLTVVVSRTPQDRSPVVCRVPTCTGQIKAIGWHPSGDRVYFLRREGHADSVRAIYEWQIGSRITRKIYVTDDWISDDCAILSDQAVCFHETPVQPRRIVSIDFKTGSVKSLFNPNQNFSALQLTRIEKLEWQDVYGNETFGHLVYPADYQSGRRYPMVIVQYRSRGFARGGTGDEYPIHVLAGQGFFVLSWDRPEFRIEMAKGSYDESGKYAYTENREHISKQSSLEFVLDWLNARGFVDPDRIGITGLSDGAETLYMGLIHSDRFAAAAVSSPPVDPSGYYLMSMRVAPTRGSLVGLIPPIETQDSRKFWTYNSLALNVDKVDAPILMNLADAEASVATQSVATLHSAGKPFETYVYPGESHIKNRPKALKRILERNVDWFNFWLRGVEDTNPDKSEQFQRWRKLRIQQEAVQKKRSVAGQKVKPLPPLQTNLGLSSHPTVARVRSRSD